jgi:hypothetical protein
MASPNEKPDPLRPLRRALALARARQAAGTSTVEAYGQRVEVLNGDARVAQVMAQMWGDLVRELEEGR